MSANSAAVSSAVASTSIGRFEIVRALGRGAQGSVYLANDPHLQRQVAIKSIGAGASAEQIARQLQEARVVSQFSHPNIVTLYDAIEADGGHFLILEYVDGETLAQLLRREGRLEPQRALRLAIQIAEGLTYAHAKQVIHRDIKPANIMIDASGTARIMDFGIAAAAGEAASAGGIMGTPGYMAPECLRNEAPTAVADVFAAGMVLYEMLVGGPAVTGANTFEIIHKISNEPFAAPSRRNENLDEEIDHLVLRAIGKSAGERYASAAAMKQAVEQYLAPAEVDAQTSGSGKGALDFLLRRMSHKTGFPALSQTISAINRIAAKSDESVQTLSAVLLKDFALTNKLLRLVNSTTYRQFGGGVSTISRAVMILGFNTVRDPAEVLRNSAQRHDGGIFRQNYMLPAQNRPRATFASRTVAAVTGCVIVASASRVGATISLPNSVICRIWPGAMPPARSAGNTIVRATACAAAVSSPRAPGAMLHNIPPSTSIAAAPREKFIRLTRMIAAPGLHAAYPADGAQCRCPSSMTIDGRGRGELEDIRRCRRMPTVRWAKVWALMPMCRSSIRRYWPTPCGRCSRRVPPEPARADQTLMQQKREQDKTGMTGES